MTKKHIAIYGSVKIPRVYCSKCKGMTFIIDGLKQCCDEPMTEDISNINKIKRMTIGVLRKKPPKFIQKEILASQDYKCLYCGKRFGSLYIRNNKILPLKLNFDHLMPYSYSRENKYNFVAACHICNGIKSNKIFNTVEELFHYIKYHREKKGIKYLDETDKGEGE